MSTPIQILLIEDHPGDARLIREYIRESENQKYDIHFATTLAEGFETLASSQINLILLDLNLPDSDGLSTFEKVFHSYPTIPIIVLTGLTDEELGVTAVQKGAQDFLNKNNLTSALLIRAIKYALNRHQMLRRLEEAQQLAKVGNWEFHANTQAFLCSPEVYRIFELLPGTEFSNLEGYLTLVHEEDRDMVRSVFEVQLPAGDTIHAEHKVICKGNHIKYVELHARPHISEIPDSPSMVGTIQDITDRKQIDVLIRDKELAERSAKMKQEFLATTSHELRTPLNAVLLISQLLNKTDLNEQQKEYAKLIEAAGNTLLNVVNDILDISLIEAGRIVLKEQPLNLSQALHDIIFMMKPRAKEKSLELSLNVGERVLPYIFCDQHRLNQILLNLLGNAIKFTESGSIILHVATLEKTDENITLTFKVTDTGIGIPESEIDKIFESFKQVDSNINRALGGTGLGLSIVEKLVHLQGGQIMVESQLEKGSTFSFTLTYRICSEEDYHQSKKSLLEDIWFNKLDILLVEDNPLNQLVVETILSGWNINVTIAANGMEAIKELRKRQFDLILMDIMMPEMDGFEATKVIRTEFDSPVKDIPIIALTANAFPEMSKRYREVGMNDILTKPIELDELAEKLISHSKIRPSVKPKDNNYKHKQDLAPGKPDPKVADLTYLKDITGGDNDVIRQAVDKYLEITPEIMSCMESLLIKKDYDELGKLAHKLKSSAGFMGMEELKELLLNIERSALNHINTEKLPDWVRKARVLTERSYPELQLALKKLN